MSGPPGTRTRSDRAEGLAALCRSALWEALTLGFCRPSREALERLVSADGAAALADAAGTLDAALAPAVLALAVVPTPDLAALEAAYARLFGHTAHGRVPPYETEYGEDSLWAPQREMSDLTAFFRAFGLLLSRDARERPDHIACACEFLQVLARKEAYALESNDLAMREEAARATRLFLRDHLGRWAPAFGVKLAREDRGGFYGALGRLTVDVVVAECRRVAVPAGPEFLRLRSTVASDLPMACGPVAGGPGA